MGIETEGEVMQRLTMMGLAGALLMLTGCAEMRNSAYVRKMTGRQAPDFELTALDGATVKLSQFRGNPVVLAFWAYG